MKQIKRAVLYYVLLSKRFFKKLSFLLLLCAVPVLALCLRNVSQQESGMLHIVLSMEDAGDENAKMVIEKLMSEDSVVHYSLVDEEVNARKMVREGKADAAWIFRRDLLTKMKNMIENDLKGVAPVAVIVREDNVALQLSRIKLICALYPDLSYLLFQDFAYNDLALREDVSEEELANIYEMINVEKNLFELVHLDTVDEPGAGGQSYILAPLRGMLALLLILCGFSANMFFMQDEEKGVLDATPLRSREKRIYIYQLAAMVPVAAAVVIALYMAGDFTDMKRELLLILLYLLDCMVFCSFIRKICRSSQWMGACIPILMLGMFVLCPVFFNLKSFRQIQYLLPPFYYLSAVRAGGWTKGILCYGIIGLALNCLIGRIKG